MTGVAAGALADVGGCASGRLLGCIFSRSRATPPFVFPRRILPAELGRHAVRSQPSSCTLLCVSKPVIAFAQSHAAASAPEMPRGSRFPAPGAVAGRRSCMATWRTSDPFSFSHILILIVLFYQV